MIKKFDALTDEQLLDLTYGADGAAAGRLIDVYQQLRAHHEMESKELFERLRYQLRISDVIWDRPGPVKGNLQFYYKNVTAKTRKLLAMHESPCTECGHPEAVHDMDDEFDVYCSAGSCDCGQRIGR